MIFIYFQAALTSDMTMSQLQPSVTDVETLRRENAGVGCNWKSFICIYLVQVLHFKPENVKHIRSIDEYPAAFQRGEIKAAFLISSHAQVFLAIHCTGYTLAGPTFNFGGLGFVSFFALVLILVRAVWFNSIQYIFGNSFNFRGLGLKLHVSLN